MALLLMLGLFTGFLRLVHAQGVYGKRNGALDTRTRMHTHKTGPTFVLWIHGRNVPWS